jgi:hypothetical protein
MRKDICIHFNGTVNDRCDAGVNYRELAGEGEAPFARLPCSDEFPKPRFGRPRVACDRKELPTPEQLAADKAEIEASMEKHRKAAPFFGGIRKSYEGTSASGVADCPACEIGELRWRIAGSNGHIHAKCSTIGCLNFME